MEGTKLWIVNHQVFEFGEYEDPTSTRFCGLFETREEAEKVAKSIHKDCTVASAVVGSMEWASSDPQGPGDGYYPSHQEYKHD